jgi:hypothetical protein
MIVFSSPLFQEGNFDGKSTRLFFLEKYHFVRKVAFLFNLYHYLSLRT